MGLKNKHIWLIGASTGIGRALALQLAEQGAILSLGARNKVELDQLLSALTGTGHEVVAIDVVDMVSVQAAWQCIQSPDIVIYNAGYYEPMSCQQYEYDKALQMQEVNYTGILRVLKYVLPDFIKRKAGHIVLVGSVAGYRGLPNAIGYGASKAAVIHLAENLRADLAKEHIKVQVVNPGFVKTRLTDKNTFKMPFIITAEEAAHSIVKGITGSAFAIDFPKKFTVILKFLRLLPYSIYFKITKHLA